MRSTRTTRCRDEWSNLLAAARNGPTLFGRDSSGAVEWMLSAADRATAYRLMAEVGLLPGEVVTLTAGDLRLEADLPYVTPGRLALPCRRELMLPLAGAMCSMLAEFLSEREMESPVFMLSSVACLEMAVRHDAGAAGLADWGCARLVATFGASLTCKEKFWGNGAAEVWP